MLEQGVQGAARGQLHHQGLGGRAGCQKGHQAGVVEAAEHCQLLEVGTGEDRGEGDQSHVLSEVKESVWGGLSWSSNLTSQLEKRYGRMHKPINLCFTAIDVSIRKCCRDRMQLRGSHNFWCESNLDVAV